MDPVSNMRRRIYATRLAYLKRRSKFSTPYPSRMRRN